MCSSLALLRGIDVESDSYASAALIDHTVDLLDIDSTGKSKSTFSLLRKRLGIQDEYDLARVRSTVKELYLDERSIAIDALRVGLQLGRKFP